MTLDSNFLDPPSLYARQLPLGLQLDQRVAIVGCGGIGMWVGYFLALAGISHFELFDSDTVSDHNLNRLPLTYDNVGKMKSEALAQLITQHRPHASCYPRTNFDSSSSSHKAAFLNCFHVICCTDSAKSRREVHAIAKEFGIRYLECGADGNNGSLSYEPPTISTELEDSPGYQSVPVFVGPCVTVAAWACYYVLLSSPNGLNDRTFRVDWPTREDKSYGGPLILTTILDNESSEELEGEEEDELVEATEELVESEVSREEIGNERRES